METAFDVLVIGGGQAGLAAGYHLRRAGIRFAILEASAQPGGSWPGYYDSLRLFSPAHYSALPGLPFPGDPARYPARDEVVAYLRAYATHFALPVRTGHQVARVERDDQGYLVHTAGGASLRSGTLIAATGSFHRPHRPAFPGQERYRGQLLHAAEYREPAPFRDRRVVVVGAGNSAIQIAVELAGVARVTLATRAPVRFRPQRPLGQDIHFWAWATGLDRLPLGRWTELSEPAGVLDTGEYQAALAANRPERRPLFARYTPNGVTWGDGTEEVIDAVILATGYRPNLDYLANLGALRPDGRPHQRAGISLAVPGLAFVGLSGQRTLASATLRGVGRDAAPVVAHLRRHLRRDAGMAVERAAQRGGSSGVADA
jgi:putative flavoprotein involved in K+ transport